MKNLTLCLVTTLFTATTLSSDARCEEPWASNETTSFVPKIHHPNIKRVSLFAANPEIVTPIGIAVAPDGRVFVQENHTHKRNSNYQGPETDRILIFEDTDQDGIADKRSVFYEGHTFSTDLLFGPDGHLYVSTRWFIGRFPNAASAQQADGDPEKLVVCNTEGDYPHNGVGGLAIDSANPEWLAFGFGENLGVDYTFVGSDGVQISGGAEGGSTYRCRTDGSQLTRQSTGHWNAFGMAYDLDGNLFSTDNDPNAAPPNRLLHVIPGADFGYEYRYGRSGLHPLVCWYGENPGTLGMIGALGEAACGLIPHGPKRLLSASWTDNRVDLHQLNPEGDSFKATREPFLSGPDDFRPVHFSYSADGRFLYFTDWVKLSYPVHGHGRIWRVEFKEPISLEPSAQRSSTKPLSVNVALAKLGSDDAYARTAAVEFLSQQPNLLTNYAWQSDSRAIARAHFAVAFKRSKAKNRTGIIPDLLTDEDSEVRFVGIKWIADEKLSRFESNLRAVLDRSDLSRRDLRATIAAIERISGDSNKEFKPEDTLLALALDTGKPPTLRAMALANVDVSHPRLKIATLASLAHSENEGIRREAIHSLVIHPDPGKATVLGEIASNGSLNASLRADAIAGLASAADGHAELLDTLSKDSDPVIAKEALRTITSAGLKERNVEIKPRPDQLAEWKELLEREAFEKPDTAVGRRLFFHSRLAGCYKCHAIQSRGSAVGPDLTTIQNQTGANQDWLLKHIVNPNAEMAPYYRPQQLLTVDGEVLVGLIVGKEGKKQGYVGTDGKVFYVDKDDVEERRELTTSIMPSGLFDALTFNEIRHLIAFLLSDRKQVTSAVSSSGRDANHVDATKVTPVVIADFEDESSITKTRTTHRASVVAVKGAPESNGGVAVSSFIDQEAGAKTYFGTGLDIEAMDLRKIHEIRFWLKTDIQSNFNVQIHSGEGASVFRCSTSALPSETWNEIRAPISEFTTPPWSKGGPADLTKIDRIQLTAFGGGPYDGKYVQMDDVRGFVATSNNPHPKIDAMAVVERGGPVDVKDSNVSDTPKTPPTGFVSLFDGKTLAGWKAQARLPVPQYPGAPFQWQLKGEALQKAKENTGRWTVENGAIVGGQEPPGSGKGAYLVSERTFGDFELMMDMKSDWKTDSGFLVRTLPAGSPGMQILVDHRPQGGIGGFYGNGIAGIHGMPFAIDATYDKKGNPIGIIAADPNGRRAELSKKTRNVLDYAADVDDFLEVWKWGQWNTIRVRCVGRIPKLTTWVNGVKIAVLDMGSIEWENYDKEACAEMLGRRGHISLEVHDNNFRTGLGKDRWWPGAVVRWKNIFIRELE
ncbi:MAG: PVC-type heme-binding CxxCH protein [Planctomycetota bacterium]